MFYLERGKAFARTQRRRRRRWGEETLRRHRGRAVCVHQCDTEAAGVVIMQRQGGKLTAGGDCSGSDPCSPISLRSQIDG